LFFEKKARKINAQDVPASLDGPAGHNNKSYLRFNSLITYKVTFNL
jgi:hypothetical protein